MVQLDPTTCHTVACELDKIAARMAPSWNWYSFATTLFATIVGAALALLGSWMLARHAQKAVYRTRLNDALVQLMESVPDRIVELEDWDTRILRWELGSGDPETEPPMPVPAVLNVRLEAARLQATGQDRATMKTLATALDITLKKTNVEDQRDWLMKIVETIRVWRDGTLDAPESTFRAMIPLIREGGRPPETRPVPASVQGEGE